LALNRKLVWNIGAFITDGEFAGFPVEFGIDLATAGTRRSTYSRVIGALGLQKRPPQNFHPKWLIGRRLVVETNNECVCGHLRTVATDFIRLPGLKDIPELGETDERQMLFAFVLRMLTNQA